MGYVSHEILYTTTVDGCNEMLFEALASLAGCAGGNCILIIGGSPYYHTGDQLTLTQPIQDPAGQIHRIDIPVTISAVMDCASLSDDITLMTPTDNSFVVPLTGEIGTYLFGGYHHVEINLLDSVVHEKTTISLLSFVPCMEGL